MNRRFVVLAVFLLSFFGASYAQGTPQVDLPLDAIELPDDEIDPSGDTWLCSVISYQGVTRATIESAIAAALEDEDVAAIISSIELTEWDQNTEGVLSITFTANTTGDDRAVTIVCGYNSYPLTQGCMQSPVYTLTAAKTTVAKGERITFTLSGSVDYAKYALFKNNIQCGFPQIGTGGTMTFAGEGDGTYTCRSTEPAEVQMNGSIAVSLYLFYSKLHTSSATATTHALSPDGETIIVPFVPFRTTSTYLNQLAAILSTYTSGGSAVWNPSMKITYNSQTQQLTLTAAPNLSSNAIINNTWFKTNSTSSLLTFTQSAGGKLNSYPCHYTPPSGTGSGALVLDGSQYLVRYCITRDGVPVGDTVVGTGGAITLPLPSGTGATARGKFSVAAEYYGQRLTMGGVYLTSAGRLVQNSNFTAVEHFLSNGADTSYIDITYYDALGYPEQAVSVEASPLKNHTVLPLWYDPLRRQDAKSYLPFVYPSEGNGDVPGPVTAPIAYQQAYYTALYNAYDAQYAYTEKVYGTSPAGRVKERIMQGEACRQGGRGGANNADMTQKFGYLSNSAADVMNIYLANASGATHKIIVAGFLPAGTLYKNRTTSPDSTVTEQFALSDGRVLLSRTYSLISGGSDTLSTYYVYDNRLRQRYVITPNGTKCILDTLRINGLQSLAIGNGATDNIALNAFKERYCYYYGYDGRGRTVEKQMPGSSALTILYDNAGRAVASQDSLLRAKSQWKFAQYDRAGRTLSQHLVYAPDAPALKAWVADSTNAGALYNYNSLNRNILLSMYRYDTKPTSSELGSAIYNKLALQQMAGVVTSSDTSGRIRSMLNFDKMLDLGTLEAYEASVAAGSPDQSLLRYRLTRYYYDPLARAVQKITIYPDGERTALSNKYAFTGNVIKSVQELTAIGRNSNGTSNGISFTPATLIETAEYDHRLRPVKSTAELFSATAANALSGAATGVKDSLTYSYDELGRMVQTTLSTSSPVTMTSAFNIQNWLTQTTVLKNNSILYAQTLRYHSPIKGAKPLFGGSISEWQVNQATVNSQGGCTGQHDTQNYLFAYDGFGRLKESRRILANATADEVTYTEKGLTYDRNGNILTLRRFGSSATNPQDSLVYTYDGDRLAELAGVSSGNPLTSAGQNNGTNSFVTFAYDVNGNTVWDGLRRITLEYTQLNTLKRIVNSHNTAQAEYAFFADGAKYSVRDSLNGGRHYLGTFSMKMTPKSTGGYKLKTDEAASSSPLLSFTLSAASTPVIAPLWRITDHLGSVRVVLDGAANVIEQNDYFPFGLRTDSGRTYAAAQANRLKFNGKELQTALFGIGLIDYGARLYDPTTARWTTQDPLAEKYTSFSPYSYCVNDPVNLVDPNGNYIDDYYDSFTGKYLGSDGSNTTYNRLITEKLFNQISDSNISQEEKIKELQVNSRIIQINEEQINNAITNAAIKSYNEKVEHQVLIILDVDNSSIYAVEGKPGDNNSANIPYKETGPSIRLDMEGFSNCLLLGQVHGHSPSKDPNSYNESKVSGEDISSAQNVRIPIFAVDAFSKRSLTTLRTHLAEPNGTVKNNYGNANSISFGNLSLKISSQFR